MARSGKGTPRKPATKFPNLRKKMQKVKNQNAAGAFTLPGLRGIAGAAAAGVVFVRSGVGSADYAGALGDFAGACARSGSSSASV